MRRVVIALVGLVAAGALAGAAYEWVAARAAIAATPPPGRLVDVGGHSLHLWCTGSGAPAVILESGLGGSSVDWGYVQPGIAEFTRVCSYDRAGTGYSDSGPLPRTAQRIAAELAVLLRRGGVDGPVVLVGASFGGFSVRMFASEQTDRAVGLVLVEATHEDQHHEAPSIARFAPMLASLGLFRLFGVAFGPSPESLAPPVQAYARATLFRASGYRAAASEIVHFPESASEVKASRRRLTIPVVVVTGGRTVEPIWRRLQRDQVNLSTRGCQIVAERSGHVVPVDQPEVVVDAVRGIVDTVRGKDVDVCGAAAAR